jgi:membrane protein
MTHSKPGKTSLTKRLIKWANAPCQDGSPVLHKVHILTRIILITGKEFVGNSLNIRASALTYTILLSLVPMLAMSTAVIKGLGGGNELKQVVYSYLDTLEETSPLTQLGFPDSFKTEAPTSPETESSTAQTQAAITAEFRMAADQIFNYVDKTDFATLGTIGVLGVLLSAILVLSNIEISMNAIWHVPAGRSLLRKVTDYLTFLILMPLSINFGFAANAVLKNDTLLNKVLGILPGPLVQIGLLFFVPLFFITLTLFLIYIFFPNTKVKSGAALIGALFAGTLWFFAQNLYIGLQVGVSKYNAIYGSFATLPLFLVWMFLGWVFILGGAQLAFACQKQHGYQLKALHHSPLEQLSAAYDILNTIYSSYTNKTKLPQKDLPAHCPAYSAALLFDSLQKLIDSQLVASTRKGHLLPSGPEDKLTYLEVVSSILGDSFPNTAGGKAASDLFQQVKPILSNNYSEKTTPS